MLDGTEKLQDCKFATYSFNIVLKTAVGEVPCAVWDFSSGPPDSGKHLLRRRRLRIFVMTPMSTSQLSDDSLELAERLQGHDDGALDDVFQRYRGAVARVIAARMDQRLRGRVDPSDIVQETLLEASRRINEYLADPRMSVRRWLLLLAEQNAKAAYRWHAQTQKRSILKEERLVQRPDQSNAGLGEVLPAQQTNPSERAIRGENRDLIRACLDRLNDVDRQVVELRYLKGWPLSEVAAELNLSRDAAAKRAIRALRKLGSLMGGHM